jgi:DNA-binding NtrC family response regulator
VLITGEAGTGKSTVARWIHEQGKRRDQPFVRVDCELLHASIAESELFGGRDGEGMLAEASIGTILFDEIFGLPIHVQSRVLRLLESSEHATPRTPRVILSTNCLAGDPWRERDSTHTSVTARLEALGALHIHVPPLRDRVADIPDLVQLFLRRAAPASHGSLEITEPALRWMMDTDWPENAGELARVVEAAIGLSENGLIVVDDVVAARAGRPESIAALMGLAAERRLSLADVEHGYIKRVIAQTGNNMTRAAQILGIDRRTLYRKLSGSD